MNASDANPESNKPIPNKLDAILDDLWRSGYNGGSYNAKRKTENQVDFWNPDVRLDEAKAAITALMLEVVGEDEPIPPHQKGFFGYDMLKGANNLRATQRATVASWVEHE